MSAVRTLTGVKPDMAWKAISVANDPTATFDAAQLPKRNNGDRRRSTAAACDFVRTKVKEK